MIFITVGTQLPFDRLIKSVDQWTGYTRARNVIAQIGEGSYLPNHMKSQRTFSPMEYQRIVADADLMVSHAGMGGILTALELGIPIVVLARRADLEEHRNDHQLATARMFSDFPQIYVAADETDLPAKIALAQRKPVEKFNDFAQSASPELLSAVRDFVKQSAAIGNYQ
jgi:UDP-N-acetylglucosamine transferase subunit ALG13